MPDRFNKWYPEQDEWLRANIYNGTLDEVAEAIYQRFGILRTRKALEVRAQRLGLSTVSNHHSPKEVCYLLGVCLRVFMWWIWAGYFPAQQTTPNRRGSFWLITDADIENFIRERLILINYQKMPPSKWRTLAEGLWKSDPYYTVSQAAKILKVTRGCVHDNIVNGKLPAEEMPVGQRGQRKIKRWAVRRSNLILFYQERRFRHLHPLPVVTATSTAPPVATGCSSSRIPRDRQTSSNASVAQR